MYAVIGSAANFLGSNNTGDIQVASHFSDVHMTQRFHGERAATTSDRRINSQATDSSPECR